MLFLLAAITNAHADPLLLDTIAGWGGHAWGEKYPGSAYNMKDGRVFRAYCEGQTPYPTRDVLPCEDSPEVLWRMPIKSIALSYGDGTLTSVVISFEGDPCERLEDALGPAKPFVKGGGMEWTTETRRARIYLCSEHSTDLEIEYTGESAGIQGTLSYLAAKKDFRGLAWGSAPDPKMKQVATEPNEVRYMTRPGDEMKLGEYALSGITYSYYKDQLFTVTVDAPPASSFGVLEVLLQAYGPGAQSNQYIDHWNWTTPNFKMRLLYDIAIGTKEGHATFIYLPLFSDYTEAREKAASGAAQGL